MFNTKIINVIDKGTRLEVDYDVLRDGKKLYSKTINMEGDTIDVQIVKNSMSLELRRLQGVEEKKALVLEIKDKEYEYDSITKGLKLKTIKIITK